MENRPSAVVIGASSGIGREVARALAGSGKYARVGITARRGRMLDETASGCPERFVTSVFDAAAPDADQRLEELIAGLGDVALIVMCSGTGHINDTLETGPEIETIRLNGEGFTRLALASYRYLRGRGGGTLAAVTSVMGLRGSGSAPSYAATKAYQINYLEGLAQKARKERSGVKVVDIRPGSVDTDMMKGEGHFWIAAPEKAARLAVRAIEKGRGVSYVSRRWVIIATLLKALPRWIYEKM